MNIKKIYIITIIMLFFLVSGAASAESFFKEPDGERGFFGEWIKPPKSSSKPAVGGENTNSTDSRQNKTGSNMNYYKWSFTAGAQANIASNGYLLFNGEVQFTPAKKMGLGAKIGFSAFPNQLKSAVYGGGNDWTVGTVTYEYFKDYITLADGTKPFLYYFLDFGKPIFMSFELESYYFLSNHGLKGFYGGVDTGVLINPSDIEAYAWYGYENPIMHIENGGIINKEVLPTLSPICFRAGPVVGYKLVFFGGITMNLSIGYTFSTNQIFNGYKGDLSAGYTF